MTGQVWVNPRQPQTLYIAQLLLYWRGGIAVLFTLLFGAVRLTIFGSAQLGLLFVLLDTVGMLAGAFGIANERRWGYWLAAAAAAAPLSLRMLLVVTGSTRSLLADPITLLFDIALVALLLHPQSRSYQRYYFR